MSFPRSLKPELDYEILKLTLLRENYIAKIRQAINRSKDHVDQSVVALFDVLREVSISIVESIDTWETAQVNYPAIITPFKWNGENYLTKMMSDLAFLDEFGHISDWLGFSVVSNPFLVPMEILKPEFTISSQSFLIIGQPIPPKDTTVKKEKEKYFKSPYKTPIVNDPNIFKHLSAANKLKKKKLVEVTNLYNANSDPFELNDGQIVNPYKTYISSEQLDKIKLCWKILCKSFPQLLENSQDLASQINTNSYLSEFSSFTGELGKIALDQSTQLSFDINQLSVENQVETGSFINEKNNFHNSLKFTSGQQYQAIDAQNETLRISTINSTFPLTSSQAKFEEKKVTIWKPHDINLQRQVARKGGDLFALTTAGIVGKIKAPWRKTRFERLENDIALLYVFSEQMKMAFEDELSQKLNKLSLTNPSDQNKAINSFPTLIEVERRKSLLEYQRKHFLMTSEGNSLTNYDHQRRHHKLSEGQILESDEKQAISVEDKMARRIQRKVRVVFGKALRLALIRKRHQACKVIQGIWRKHQVHKLSHDRNKKLRLAIILQRLYRSASVKEILSKLKQEYDERVATLTIQRTYRGYRGRMRLQLKREFISSIFNANKSVSFEEFHPGDLDELADAIDITTRDYNYVLPLGVLTVIRAVLFILNGDESESVNVSNSGFVEKKYFSASTLSWSNSKLFLRRKGRLMRRLRAFMANVSLPNPCKVVFTEDCVHHLTNFHNHFNDTSEFDEITLGKKCILQLYRYCINVFKVYRLQNFFPEYFDTSQPDWFRRVMKLKNEYDHVNIQHKTNNECKLHLNKMKEYYGVTGKSWKNIADAVSFNDNALENSKQNKSKYKIRLFNFLKELETNELKKLHTLENLVRSRQLALSVSQGDLREYMRLNFIVDEVRLRELQQNVDLKILSLLETRAELTTMTQTIGNNKIIRNFDKLMKYKQINELCANLGIITGELLVLSNMWQSLLKSIGGVQYVPDLEGEKLDQYNYIRLSSINYMKQRNALLALIESSYTEQIDKVYKIQNEIYDKMRTSHWDNPTPVEIEAEAEENRE
eukprot:gene5550-7671_t